MIKSDTQPAPAVLGFTLLELMMTLLVLSILMTMTITYGRSLWVENRGGLVVKNVIQILNYARSTAILSNEKIIVCPSSDRRNCDSSDWSKEQIVRHSSGELLRVFAAQAPEDRLIWNGSLNQNQAIEWLPTGYTNGQRGSFYFCPGNAAAEYAEKIVLLNTGRMYAVAMNLNEYQQFCGE